LPANRCSDRRGAGVRFARVADVGSSTRIWANHGGLASCIRARCGSSPGVAGRRAPRPGVNSAQGGPP
jgi:hypothetical protein